MPVEPPQVPQVPLARQERVVSQEELPGRELLGWVPEERRQAREPEQQELPGRRQGPLARLLDLRAQRWSAMPDRA